MDATQRSLSIFSSYTTPIHPRHCLCLASVSRLCLRYPDSFCCGPYHEAAILLNVVGLYKYECR
jgi:hypothetical protein